MRRLGLVAAIAFAVGSLTGSSLAASQTIHLRPGDQLTVIADLPSASSSSLPGSPVPSAVPTAAPTPAPTPAPTVTPLPQPSPAVGYAATYTARGGDETASLKAFIEANRGKRMAIVGQIGVTSLQPVLPAGPTTTIDFLNGAGLRALDTRATATLYLRQAFDVVLDDYRVTGRGFGTYMPQYQWQHGLGIYGGGRITVNRPVIDSTFGDGIDVDVEGSEATPIAIAINSPTITRAERNGITGNAGQVTVTGGSIDQTGLHNIDLEPNHDREAMSIDFSVSGTRLTRASAMPVFDTPGQIIRGRAFSGLGYSAATKQAIRITNCSSDDFQIAVDHASLFTFTGNRSDSPVAAPSKTAFYYAIGTKTISGNTQISLVEYAFR